MSSYIQSLLKDPSGLAGSISPAGPVAAGKVSIPEAFPDSPPSEEDNVGILEGGGDVVMGFVRGTEGFIKYTVGAVDMLVGGGDGEMFGVDLESNWSGDSQTMPGQFVQGATQFLLGFVPVLGWLGKAQKFSSLGKYAGIARTTTASTVADALAFDGQQQRLSNLLVQYPALENPVTDFLAADEDDSEAAGRLKNVIEGMGVGLAAGSATAIVKGIALMKKARKLGAEGLTPEQIKDELNGGKEATEVEKGLKGVGVPKTDPTDPPRPTPAALDNAAASVTDDNSASAVSPGVGVKPNDTSLPGGAAALDTTASQIKRLETVHGRADVAAWVDKAAEELKDSEKFLGGFKEFRESTLARAEVIGEEAGPLASMSEAQLKSAWSGQESLFRALAVRQDRAWLGVTASAEQLSKASNTVMSNPSALNEQAFKDALERHQNFIAEYTSYGRGASFLLLGRKSEFRGSASDLIEKMRGAEVNDAMQEAPAAKGSRTAEGADLSRDIDEVGQVSDPEVSKNLETRKEERLAEIEERLKEGVDSETEEALKQEQKAKQSALEDQKKLTSVLEELEKVKAMTPEEQAAYFKRRQAKAKTAATKDLTAEQKRTKQVQAELKELRALAQKPEKELKQAKAKLEKKRKELESLRSQLFVTKRLIEKEPPKVKAEKQGELKRLEEELKTLEDAEKFYGRMITDAKLEEEALKILDENATLSTARLKEIQKELKLKRDKFPKETKGSGAQLKEEASKLRASLIQKAKKRLHALNLETEQEFSKYINTTFGSGDVKTLARRYSFLSHIEDPAQRAFALHNYSKAHIPGKLLDGGIQAFMGSILSAPATVLVNGLGPALALGMKSVETVAGSVIPALRGSVEAEARLRAVADVSGFFEDLTTSWRNAIASFKQDESAFLGSARAWDENLKGRGAFAPEVWEAQGTFMEQGLNWFNNLSRLPMRFLGATDDFYKTLAAHRLVRQEAIVEAVSKHGITDGRLIADYVSKTVDGHFLQNTMDNTTSIYTEKGLLIQGIKEMKAKGIEPSESGEQTRALFKYIEDNRRGASDSRLAERAIERAKEITFTKELEGPIGKSVETALKEYPVFKFILPFLRTPWNILGFALTRTPLGAAGDQIVKHAKNRADSYKNILENGSGQEIVELRGRLAASTAYTAALVWYVQANGDKISGAGPQNKQEREALRATGWQPYSWKVGDTWISYQRVDPLTTLIGLVADIKDGLSYRDDEKSQAAVFSALALSVSLNITDRSYLRGLNNVLNIARDPETYVPKVGKDIIGGFVPNIINKTQDTAFFNNQDENRRILREARGLMDSIIRRVPVAAENLPPKRTILGDPVYKDNLPGLWESVNFAQISRSSKSLVDNEIANLSHGFSKPSVNFRGIPELNMQEIYNEQGREAYDRWLELSSEVKINGRTLRQSLKKLYQSSAYKKLPDRIMEEQTGQKSPRIALTNRIIRAYRQRAQFQLMEEFPELVSGFKKARKAYYEEVTGGNPIPAP